MARRRKGFFGTICIILILVLLVGGLGYATNGFTNWDITTWFQTQTENKENVTDENGNEMNGNQVYEMPKKLNFSAVSASSSAPQGITLQATVLPENASNKAVDWSVSWSEDSVLKNENVSDYLTVVPASDGSTTAVITCLKSFRDNTIIITVTTREGGFKADCIVSFVGKPSGMSIVTNIQTVNDSKNGIYTPLGTRKTYNFDIQLDNAYDDVGNDYADFTVTMTTFGSIIVDTRYSGMSGSNWAGTEKSIALSSIASEFVTYSIQNGKLHIETKSTIDSYYASSSMNNTSVRYYDMFKSYDDRANGGYAPYFEFTVTENKSGLTALLKIQIVSSVTGVAFNSSLTF